MDLKSIKVACSNCNLRELCMPVSLSLKDSQRLDDIVKVRRRIKSGDALFWDGNAFDSLFAIRFGFFKTYVTNQEGRIQVTGFQMAGDIMGLDGIASDLHTCNAIALEDSEVCVIPFANVEDLSREFPILQRHVHKIMSREIVHEHNMMMLLGSMSAREKLAAFLVNFAKRLCDRGLSQSQIILRMSREDIGSYLGMKIETVSRTFSAFSADGLIDVKQRHLQIIDLEGLKVIANA